ncbi:uncharacterized protein LOC101856136 [Aplysia californica]|uniref:Uncharacterized protein LOC101856136 n=1 Tax=Aplysia californica TaxID=6500 RepID=A0ABM0K772_APLCA|nr:uncharacterized protein LOC101856136 [Aplysia californica]
MSAMMYNMTQSPPNASSSGGNESETEATEMPAGLSIEIIVVCVNISILCVFGTVGNALAFFIYYRKREKGTSTIFILSLAVTDFFTCLIAMPYTIVHEMIQYRHHYDVSCKMYLFIQTFNIPLSALIMVAIAFDRYFCICHPFLHVVTVPRAKICIVLLTFVSVLLGVVPTLAHGVYYYEDVAVSVNDTIANSQDAMANGDFLRDSSSGFGPASPSSLTSSPSSLYSSPPSPLSLASAYSRNDDAKTAIAFIGSTVAPLGSWKTTSEDTLYTNGLFLEPDEDFINDLAGHSRGYSYETDLARTASTFPTLSTSSPVSGSTSNTSSYFSILLKENGTSQPAPQKKLRFLGHCVMSNVIFSEEATFFYQKFYAALFLVEFIVIAVLYALIYRSILVRRAWKAKRKRMSCYASTNCPETVAEETQLTNINGAATENIQPKKNPRISATMRDRTLYANIKTAAMLFVVTIFFVLSFLPSWFMGLKVVHFNVIVFYMFYINNVINPIVYAFMNRTFRDDLFQLLKSCIRH